MKKRKERLNCIDSKPLYAKMVYTSESKPVKAYPFTETEMSIFVVSLLYNLY